MAKAPPPITVAEVSFRCPDGRRVIDVPGPTANEALRKAAKLARDPRAAAARCYPGDIRLVKRGAGARTQALDPAFAGARRRRKRR